METRTSIQEQDMNTFQHGHWRQGHSLRAWTLPNTDTGDKDMNTPQHGHWRQGHSLRAWKLPNANTGDKDEHSGHEHFSTRTLETRTLTYDMNTPNTDTGDQDTQSVIGIQRTQIFTRTGRTEILPHKHRYVWTWSLSGTLWMVILVLTDIEPMITYFHGHNRQRHLDGQRWTFLALVTHSHENGIRHW
jgi:hypothetical protein